MSSYAMFFHQMGENNETLFYESSASDLTTAIVEPQLKLELSKAGSLEFKIMPTHPNFNDFHKLSTYVRVCYFESEIFRGRVLDIEDTIYLERTVKCEGDLSYLVDSLQPPDKTREKDNTKNRDVVVNNSAQRQSLPADIRNQMPYEQKVIAKANLEEEVPSYETPREHFARYISNHNLQVDSDKQFQIGLVTIDDADVDRNFTSSAWRDTKEAFDSDLIKYHGGYLQTRPDPNGGHPFIDYIGEPSDVSSQPIMLGLNMVDLTKESKGDDVFTVFVPIGKDGLTIENLDLEELGIDLPEGITIAVGSKGIEIDDGVEHYGYIYQSENFSSTSDPVELLTLGLTYIASNYKQDPLKITAKAVDLNLIDTSIEELKVGSIINVISSPHELNDMLICTSIEYDIQNPEDNTYEIGDPSEALSRKTISDKIKAGEEMATTSSRSNYAIGTSLDLQAAVNRHAETIVDQADTLYSLTADTIRISADLLEIRTRALDIQSETVTVNADIIDLANIRIEPDSEFDVHINGSLWADEAFFDGVRIPPDKIYGFIDGGSGGTGIDQSRAFLSSTTISAQHFRLGLGVSSSSGNNAIYFGVNGGYEDTWINATAVSSPHHLITSGQTQSELEYVDLKDCILSFGQAYNVGTITHLPFSRADGTTGEVTFSKAASVTGGWSSGYYNVTATDDPNTTLLSTQLFGLNKLSQTISGTDITASVDVMYYDSGSGSVYNWSRTGYTGNVTVNVPITSSRTVTLTSAQQTISPTQGDMGMAAVTVNVPLTTPPSVTPTTSQQIITPDPNDIGLTQVIVEAASGGSSSPSDIRLGSPTWYDSNSHYTPPSSYTQLTSIPNMILDHQNDQGYIVFQATLSGVSGSKGYYITIG